MKRVKSIAIATALLGGVIFAVPAYSEVSAAPKPVDFLPVQQGAKAPPIQTAQDKSEAEAQAAKAKQAAESAASEKLLNDAESLILAGRPSEAYVLLQPSEFVRSGEKRFDYLLGISALDSGKPDKATLALERVLAVDPNFAGARLDMARAYYPVGRFGTRKN